MHELQAQRVRVLALPAQLTSVKMDKRKLGGWPRPNQCVLPKQHKRPCNAKKRSTATNCITMSSG